MTRVIYSPAAIQDIEDVTDWIAPDDANAAARVVDSIDAKLQLIAAFPHAGEDVGDLLPGMRRTIQGPYVIYYRPGENRVDVIRIVHGARDIGSLFP